MKIQKTDLLRIIRTFIVSFLFMFGFYKLMQEVFSFANDPAYMPYMLALLVAVWNTVEVAKEIGKSNTQVVN